MSDKQSIHIKVDPAKVRNEFPFNIQKRNRMNIFRDRTKYTRKRKHKNMED